MTSFLEVETAVIVKFDFWEHAGEIYPNKSGNDPYGDYYAVSGSSENDTDRNIIPAPGKGIYNPGDAD